MRDMYAHIGGSAAGSHISNPLTLADLIYYPLGQDLGNSQGCGKITCLN